MLLVLGVVVAGVLPLVTAGDESYEEARRGQEMLRNVRVALGWMARDVRPSVAAEWDVSARALRLQVERGTSTERVEYALQGQDLVYRRGSEPPSVLGGPFSRFDVRCFDGHDNPVACSDPGTRQLELELEAVDPDTDPVRGPVDPLRVVSRVARRVP